MKTTENIEDAIHIPWHHGEPFIARFHREVIAIGNGAEHIAYVSVTGCVPLEQAKAHARLIVQSVNERAALLAMRDQSRDFAHTMIQYLEMKLDGYRRVDKLPENHAIVATAVEYLAQANALANLVTVREGGAK